MTSYQQALAIHLLLLSCFGNSAAALQHNNLPSFVGTPRSSFQRVSSENIHRRTFAPSSWWQETNASAAIRLRASILRFSLNAKSPLSTDDDSATTVKSGNANDDSVATNISEFTQALESNDLQAILTCLQSHSSFIPSLTNAQLRSIFDAIEVATAETDENTVNKRAIDDANLISAASSSSRGMERGVEFRSLDRVRAQMTKLYQLLREEGKLKAFGAVGRQPPSQSIHVLPQGPIYPTAGSKIITPTLLEQITDMSMTNLTPRPTNFLLYGGVALALLEGLLSLYFNINFNLLVVSTLLLALADQSFQK